MKREPPRTVRCAIYTRKSTDEGLDQSFNSLDAQRDSAEAYIRSQSHEGWTWLAERYDDGGYTGANTERPALKRLMSDIQSGGIDCVVVYKVDRLSRSLLDFSRLMETFEKYDVAFVSVTQQFNTATSMGRLMQNVLLSFAQFEREIISERTRDKIAAARRKGKWTGGKPILGYEIEHTPGGSRLVANTDEAAIARQIFELYADREAMIPVVRVLNERGWRTKQWTTKGGRVTGGRQFDKTALHQLLTNVAYIGKVRHGQAVYEGEHEAIIPNDLWAKVQATLQRNGRSGGSEVRNKYGALLRGLITCAHCRCGMAHTYSSRGVKRYRYYTCLNAQKRGWHSCPHPSVPAGEVERFVVEQIRGIGRDPLVLDETIRQVREQSQKQADDLGTERRALERQLRRDHAALRQARDSALLADLHERIGSAEKRLEFVKRELAAAAECDISEEQVREALARFDPLWEVLTPQDQARFVGLLVQRVVYDGENESVSITLNPVGLQAFAEDTTLEQEVAA